MSIGPRIHCGMTIGWHIRRYWSWTVVRHIYCRLYGHKYYSGYYIRAYSWKYWCMRCGHIPVRYHDV